MRVAGIGLRSDASEAALAEAIARAGGAPEALATLDSKADHPALRALAARLAVPLHALPVEALRGQPCLTRSARIEARFGTGSIAEAAALAAAGTGATLLGPRQISNDGSATAAIAEGAPT